MRNTHMRIWCSSGFYFNKYYSSWFFFFVLLHFTPASHLLRTPWCQRRICFNILWLSYYYFATKTRKTERNCKMATFFFSRTSQCRKLNPKKKIEEKDEKKKPGKLLKVQFLLLCTWKITLAKRNEHILLPFSKKFREKDWLQLQVLTKQTTLVLLPPAHLHKILACNLSSSLVLEYVYRFDMLR